MINLTLGDNVVVFFDSIKSLPNARKMLADQYSLWDNGIGGGIEKIRENIVNAKAELHSDNKANAEIYIENADIAIEATRYGEDFRLKELSCFVKSIGDFTYPNIIQLDEVDKIAGLLNENGITIGQVDETLDFIKKNLIEN